MSLEVVISPTSIHEKPPLALGVLLGSRWYISLCQRVTASRPTLGTDETDNRLPRWPTTLVTDRTPHQERTSHGGGYDESIGTPSLSACVAICQAWSCGTKHNTALRLLEKRKERQSMIG